jgi:hypothetical protein
MRKFVENFRYCREEQSATRDDRRRYHGAVKPGLLDHQAPIPAVLRLVRLSHERAVQYSNTARQALGCLAHSQYSPV